MINFPKRKEKKTKTKETKTIKMSFGQQTENVRENQKNGQQRSNHHKA